MFVKSAVIISMCIGNYAVCFVDVLVRDGPLEKLWGGGNFRAAGIFFSSSNSLYEYFFRL